MIIGSGGRRGPLGPVVAKAFLRLIVDRVVLVVPADGVGGGLFAGPVVFVSFLVPVLVISVVGNGPGPGAGIFRIGILGRVSNGNLPFQVVVDELASSQVGAGVVGDGNLRAAVRRHDPAIAGAADVARQVDFAPLGLDVLNRQAPALRIVVHLGHILVDAGGVLIDRLVAVVHLVHGLALDCDRAAVVLQHLDMLFAEGLDLIAVLVRIIAAVLILHVFGDLRRIQGITALDQAVDIDGIRRYIYAVPGDTAGIVVCVDAFIAVRDLYFLIGRRFFVQAVFGALLQLVRFVAVQVLGVAADIHDAFGIILGYAALGGDQGHVLALHAGGADGDITLLVLNGYAAVTVSDILQHFHVGHGGIGGGLARRLRLDLKLRPHRLVVVQHTDKAFAVAGGIAVQGRKRRVIRGFLVGVLVQLVDLLVPGVAALDAVALETDLAPVFPYVHFIGPQVGVGVVVDLNLGMPVGLELACAVQVVGLDRDAAAADGDVRNLRVADGIAAGDIGLDCGGGPVRIGHGIFLVHVPLVHLIIDALALGDIAVVGGRIVAVAAVVLGDQLVQFGELFA